MTKHLFKKIFCLLAILAIALVLIACDGDKVEAKLDFEKSTLTVEVGDEFDIKTTVSGVDASTAVEFTFDKDGIVKYENGKFTAVAAGEVKITGTVKGYSDATATLTVTVNEKKAQVNAKVKLTVAKTEGYAGDKINVSVALEDADDLDDQTVTFEVSSANATYADGVLTLVAVGEVTLTAKLASYPEVIDSVNITILEKEPTLTITPSATSVAAGGKVTVAAVADPATAEIEWSSSDEEVATVASGVVTALKNGKTTITATIKGTNVSKSFELTVAQLVTNISVQYVEEMEVFDSQDIVITVTPEDAGDKSVTITSSDEDVIIAANDGTLTALEAGTAVITVTANDGSGVKYEFTVTVTDSANIIENTLCDPAVASLASGTEYEYKGQTYVVDKTAFSTIELAIEATTKRVYVAAGTYDANVIINKDGIELYGPNAGINPNTITRLDEAVMTGTITVSEGLKNIVINGFAFTGAGMVDCQNSVDGIEVSYNNVYNTNAVADAWVETRVELEAIFDFWATSGNEIKNIKVLYNKFENIDEPAIFIARCKNVTVNNNVVHNFTKDAIRADGGYNYGYWEFDHNKLYNDQKQAYAGLYLQSVSGRDDDGSQVISITNNEFENIGVEGTSSYICALGARTFQEQGLKADVLYNTFTNCNNFIHFRNNGTAPADFELNINYNKFVGVPVTFYHINSNPGSNDTTSSNPVLANMDYNLFIDDAGAVITDLSAYEAKFIDVLSKANNYQSVADYEAALKALTGVTYKYVVDDDWKDLAADTEVTAEGFTWTIGKDAFASIAECLGKLEEGATIKVLAGNYDDTLTIGRNNITLMGPNAGVNAQYVNRDAEAVLGGPINFVEGISNFTVDGFEFTGAAALFPIKDCKNIAMKYCVINGTSTDGVIRSSTDAGGLVYDIKFIGNYSNNYKGLRVLHLTYCDGLDASNNYIQTTGATYDFINSQQLLKGEVVFKDNTFVGGSNQSFIYARLIGNTNVLIQGNYIEDVVCTGIDFRDMTEENGKATFNILNNTLKNCGNDWRPIRIRTAGYKEGNEIVVNVNYNKFIDSYVVVDGQLTFVNNPSQGSVSDPFNVIYNMDNNYYEVDGDVIIPDSNDYFGGAALSWEGSYASESDMPAYSAANEVKPTSLEITNKITNMDAYDTYQLTFQIGPSDATNKKIAFKTSNASAATVSSAGLISAKSGGTATITAYCVADNSVVDSLTITVAPKSRVEIRCEGNGILYVNGATAKLETTYYGSGNGGITYTSSDPTIATVDASGVVTGLKAGQVEITASQDGKEAKISFTVLTEELTGVLKVLADGNHATIWNQNIFYIGSDDGSADYEHNIYGSANDYYAGTLPEVQLNMLASTAPNNPNQKMKSVEFIVVHDTAGSPSTSTAYANSHWCTNPSNSGTSWHYTIGNDGIYKQAEDDMVMWHAGDGTAWGESTTFYDTGIPYEGDRPTVTVGNDYYFYVNGKKSNVMSPTTETKTINTLGLVCVKGDNGNYFIPTTYVNSSFNGAHICARGGGLNGIGIETAVNMGSDVYLTWQYTAKFCAALVIKHNLAADRIWFHNNFSNKKCPNTMITANRVDTFLKLVYAEYEIAKNYSDYEIKFESSNPSILDNTGRVVKTPEYTTNVSYKVIVTKGTDVQELTLNTLVIGQYNL